MQLFEKLKSKLLIQNTHVWIPKPRYSPKELEELLLGVKIYKNAAWSGYTSPNTTTYNAEFLTKKGKTILQAGKDELITRDKEINWRLALSPTKILFPYQALLKTSNHLGYYDVFEAKEVYKIMEQSHQKQK